MTSTKNKGRKHTIKATRSRRLIVGNDRIAVDVERNKNKEEPSSKSRVMVKYILGLLIATAIGCGDPNRLSNSAVLKESSSYIVEPISAQRMSDNTVIGFLKVSPKYTEAFPPVLSMKVGYGESRSTKAVDVQKQTERGKVQIAIYDSTIEKKNSAVYEAVKDEVNVDELGGSILLAFTLTDLIAGSADSLYLTYGLWEKANTSLRVEKTYGLKIKPGR